MAQTSKFDLFILDIIIPGINGIELCKKLKQHIPIFRCLCLQHSVPLMIKLSGFEAGANDYLVKPFEFRELLARVKVLLRNLRLPLSGLIF